MFWIGLAVGTVLGTLVLHVLISATEYNMEDDDEIGERDDL